MAVQLDLFSGTSLKRAGMSIAEDSANNAVKDWSKKAYNYLLAYARYNKQFMAEDVRIASANYVPVPPSARAWGAVFSRAAKAGIIKRNGYRAVKNPAAHCTPASVWVVS